MSRKVIGKCPDVPASVSSIPTVHPNKTSFPPYRIQVITPILGGGAEPMRNDPATLIRGSSVRGHLRFWWRAIRGAAFDSVSKLREREALIWGSVEAPGVEIEVSIRGGSESKPWTGFADTNDKTGYVLFPCRDTETKLRTGVEFELTIRYPRQRDDFKTEIEGAIWGWVNFGGIGARTRRGCGALFCRALAPKSAGEIERWLAEAEAKYGLTPNRPARAWPVFAREVLVGAEMAPLRAWNSGVTSLWAFRQGAGVGRNGARGRSRWPEADTLRMIFGDLANRKYSERLTVRPGDPPAFPRAELGLPIVFHMKSDPAMPKSIELHAAAPDGTETRMASPVIVRPLGVGDGSRAVPMLACLVATRPTEVKFKNAPKAFKAQHVRRAALAGYPNSPMKGTAGSALDAFLAFAKTASGGNFRGIWR